MGDGNMQPEKMNIKMTQLTVSCLTLMLASMVVLGRDTTIPSDGSDENRSNLLVINQGQLRMEVDVINCRWPAHLKGTKVSKKFMGTFKGTFTSRANKGPDCDVYSRVEKQNHPVLLSTSRHIRHMAFDIKNMNYDKKTKTLIGLSRAVSGDPYQLLIYVPQGYELDRVEVPAGLKVETKMDDRLLMINFTTDNEDDVEWKVYFK